MILFRFRNWLERIRSKSRLLWSVVCGLYFAVWFVPFFLLRAAASDNAAKVGLGLELCVAGGIFFGIFMYVSDLMGWGAKRRSEQAVVYSDAKIAAAESEAGTDEARQLRDLHRLHVLRLLPATAAVLAFALGGLGGEAGRILAVPILAVAVGCGVATYRLHKRVKAAESELHRRSLDSS